MLYPSSLSIWPHWLFGYRRFNTNQIPSLDEKVFIVTGGNTGLGYETTLQLVKKHAVVYIACRNEEKARVAIAALKDQIADAKVHFIQLDLEDTKGCVLAAKQFMKDHDRLDCIIANGGLSFAPFRLTKDKIECHFATNPSPARIVIVSSEAYLNQTPDGINFDALRQPQEEIIRFTGLGGAMKRYADSKLANILFSKILATREPSIITNSCHPGLIFTGIGLPSLAYVGDRWFTFYRTIMSRIGLSVADGALTQLFLATSPLVDANHITGKFYVPIAYPVDPVGHANDEELAIKLWKWTDSVVKEVSGDAFSGSGIEL